MTTKAGKQIIVEVGAEGGSITLFGARGDQGWLYSLSVNDWTLELLGEEPIQRESAQVDTWDKAVKLLDRYHWRQLWPLHVHPEFRQKVLAAVRSQLKDDDGSESRLQDWLVICGAER